MLEWNDNFTNKRWVGDTSVISCPMYIDNNGNIFFIYNDNGVYISDYMGCFDIHELLKG